MNLKYGQSRTSRKAFVQAISTVLEEPATYQGAPTFAYAIENYVVDIHGNLSCPEDTDKKAIRKLVSSLQKLGYTPENYDELFSETIENSLVIEIPRTGFTEQALSNLQKIVDSKATLLKLALDTEDLSIKKDEEKLYFPWFTLHDIEGEADAYSRLVIAMAEMAKRQKRITATEKPICNAKFSMRVFLIRLGFIGGEYKTARKILLRNLTGNSSWKAGKPPERTSSPVSQTNTITDNNRLLESGLKSPRTETAEVELFPEKENAPYHK